MLDLLYWTARATLVATWLVVAVRAWSRRRSSPRVWSSCATIAVAFASVRVWPWNYALLELARAGLREAGVYDERFWFKLALATGLVLGVAAARPSLRRLIREPAEFGCCIGLGLQGILLAIETMSLDEAIPQFLVQQPGRYLAEGCFAGLALLAVLRPREVR